MDTVITFGDGSLKAKCIKIGEEGIRYFQMIYTGIFYEILDKLGTMPLPPYIKEQLNDLLLSNSLRKNRRKCCSTNSWLAFY